jgi:AraC-like DNA-binding protein
MLSSYLIFLAPATAATLVFMALLVGQVPGLPGRRELSLSFASGALYFLSSAFPAVMALCLPMVLIGPLVFNRATRAGFEAAQRPVWADLCLMGILVGCGTFGYMYGPHWLAARTFDALSLWLFLEVSFVVWRGLSDDLIESHRNLRLWFLGLGAGLGLVIAVGVMFGEKQSMQGWGAVMTMGLCFGLVAFGRPILNALAVADPIVPAQAHPEPKALDAREVQVLRRLKELMAQEIWRDPGLSLTRLAQRLEVPEHRLRRVIHVGEGYGNFTGFINAHRLSAFKARIEDAAADSQTILNLALEVGYSSLSVFNRAFKAAEGVTPSALRLARMAARTEKTQASPIKTKDTTSVE